MTQERRSGLAALIVLVLLLSSIILYENIVNADPEGATVTYVSNTTKNSTTPGSRNDSKGTITTILLSTTQQNIKWKAYVGNVSGTLVLRDADDYSIYEWAAGGSPDGEVYITRNSTVTWSTIQCANDTSITDEQNTLGHSATASDNINNTFLTRVH